MIKTNLLTKGAVLLALSTLNLQPSTLLAQGTAFTVQGRLNTNGAPASGLFDVQVWALNGYGVPVSTTNTFSNTSVSNGIFAISPDFGPGVFTGDFRSLQFAFRPAGSGSYTMMSNVQPVTPTPYAMYAATAATASNLASGSVVRSLNSLKDNINLIGTNGVSVIPNGNNIYIYGSGSGSGSGGTNGPWSTMGSSIYYNGGGGGIGTPTPANKLHLWDPAVSVSHIIETGGGTNAWAKVEFRNANGQWAIGTSRAWNGDIFYIDRAGNSSLDFALAPGGNLGLGVVPANHTKMTMNVPGNIGGGLALHQDYGLEQTDGNVRLSSHLIGDQGASIGTRSAHKLNFFVNSDAVNGGSDLPPNPDMTIDTAGNVGIGTPSPVVKLDVRGSGITESTVWSTGERAILSLHSKAAGVDRIWTLESGLYGTGGLFGIYDRSANRVGMSIDTVGNAFFGGPNASVCTLTIRGGCDLAEPFPMKEESIDKGSVVVIDEEHPGKLTRSTRAYDTRVAGIVSGANGVNPGIALKQEGTLDQGQNVALSGRVYVKADASFGEIKPGDLLTTSDTPGHAMKVTDHVKAQGAVLGKAMNALKEGRGMVLVLVTLQ